MKQFDSIKLLTRKASLGSINKYAIKNLAKQIAFFHLSQSKSFNSMDIDITKSVKRPVLENIEALTRINLPEINFFLKNKKVRRLFFLQQLIK